MKHFYFIENNTGEEFLVGAENLSMATIIEYEMTDEEAEASGLDEY